MDASKTQPQPFDYSDTSLWSALPVKGTGRPTLMDEMRQTSWLIVGMIAVLVTAVIFF